MDADLHLPDSELDPHKRLAWTTAERCLARVYGGRSDFNAVLGRVASMVKSFAEARPEALRLRDRRQQRQPAWWREGRAVGYSAYVDRFAGDLRRLRGRLPYLEELGVSYLHLLPLFKARTGDNDGGFAVADFGAVEPRLGTTADLEDLAGACRAAGISLVLDLVCNHTSDDHAWAKAARAGDPRYRDYYHVLRDPDEVQRYEAHLVDVFPDVAPGSFTYCEPMAGWVWTTFYPFQWDLNYANPAVFCEMLAVMLRLANLGVDGLRLDSAPFLWKRPGTDCRNQPEVHALLATWRALLSMAAPGVVLKAEAIERLADVKTYFGQPGGDPECHLAYNNGAMTALWASLALGSAEPARRLIQAAAAKPAEGAWVNYVRCHDDIIWSALSPHVSTEDQGACSRFYAGKTRSSAAGGAIPSTNGMASSLVGIVDDDPDSAPAQRLLLLYGVTYALDGIPVVWMGDEIGLGDNPDADPSADGARDGRWAQRPVMDWDRAGRRDDPVGLPGRAFMTLATFARLRAAHPAFGADHVAAPVDSGDPAVLSVLRAHPAEAVQCLANFSAEARSGRLALAADGGGAWSDLLCGETGAGPAVPLAPFQVRWLVARS